ncbi:MAG TPA: phospholipase D-like domain-containing protein [Steroidobacteraceae bacterium]|nr:phospholipase D-like domain-containing protein [Steroidobacteraceae bacterium]
MSHPGRKFAALLGIALAAAGCAHVPVVDEADLVKASDGSQIKVFGARGPLSSRQSRAVLGRLAAQWPDAGALERHLAVEQIVAESPLFIGNQVRILRDGTETFPAMFAAIRQATRYLYLEYYIFEDVTCEGETLSDLLVRQSQAGVHVRVIYDGIGSIGTDSGFFDKLRAAGVQMAEFNPPNPWKRHFALNSRDHRKLLVADGTVAILGGVNLSSTYQSAPQAAAPEKPQDVWHDTDIQIIGPVVPELETLFRDHWHEQQGVPLGADADPDPPSQPPGDEVVRILGSSPAKLKRRYYVTAISAIRNAESSIWITGAYFVPTHQEKEGLMAAARRGVDVRLLLPAHSDSGPALAVQHSHYEELLRAGVKIYERDDGILHSKTMVIDRVWSIVGSSNFDHRSVLFNDELDAVVLGKETGERLADDFTADLQHAQEIEPDQWARRSALEHLRESFWRLWEQLL